jgi:cell division protein FtsL
MTKRIVLIALIVLSAVGLTACAGGNAVSKQTKTYKVTSDIHSLDIEINAAEFIIEEADEFLANIN